MPIEFIDNGDSSEIVIKQEMINVTIDWKGDHALVTRHDTGETYRCDEKMDINLRFAKQLKV
jgi:hypothetical protein